MSEKRLKEIIESANDGSITNELAERRLSFLDWRENEHQFRENKLRVSEYINQGGKTYGVSPEEILVKQETSQEYQQLLTSIRQRLTARQQRVFDMRFIKGLTQERIGKSLRLDHSTISRELQKIEGILRTYATQETHEILSPPAVNQFSGQSVGVKVRYPFEFLQKQKPCGIPQYIPQDTVCTLCDKCTCKDMRERRET